MRDLKNNLTTSGKGSTNIQSRRGKSFGYQILGFGAGGARSPFIVATGGTISTVCTNYKVHTFTGNGTFTVCAVSATPALNVVDYTVVAGGGGGAANQGGGGGGGFRFYANTPGNPQSGPAAPINNYGASPNTAVTVSATGYPITVGAGGVASCEPYPGPGDGARGVNSVFSTVTSTGGGGGSNGPTVATNSPGGSGGGGGNKPCSTGGLGNTPPVSPSQGTNGGSGLNGPNCNTGGGGGGALVAGTAGTNFYQGGIGGAGGGLTGFGTTGQPSGGQYYFSGGGGANSIAPVGIYGAGGLGGGGASTGFGSGSAGTDNTGGGGGGGGASGAGGSGIVLIRYKFQ